MKFLKILIFDNLDDNDNLDNDDGNLDNLDNLDVENEKNHEISNNNGKGVLDYDINDLLNEFITN